MKTKEIESKDQELIKNIRTILHNKEKENAKKKEEKPAHRRFPFGLIIILITLIISSSVLLFKQRPILISPSEPVTTPRVEPVRVTPEHPASTPGTVEIKTIPKSSDLNLNTPVIAQESCAKVSKKNVTNAMPLEIQIEKIISCSSVNNRQYNNPKIKFSLAQGDTPRIWMNVISQNPPSTLTHVYYRNGKKYFKIPLAIHYPRTRTWSSVTLRSEDDIGKWRVEVIDKSGVKLAQIEFIVVK